MASNTKSHHEELVGVRRKVRLRCGAMLEDKHCFKFGSVITCKKSSYCGILDKTMEEKRKINDQNE